MVSLSYKIGAVFLIAVGLFTGGYWQGRQHGREATLKAAVQAYKTREKINHETDNLSSHALCLALGGLRGECDDLLLGLAKAAQD